jgi:hypothetical protein
MASQAPSDLGRKKGHRQDTRGREGGETNRFAKVRQEDAYAFAIEGDIEQLFACLCHQIENCMRKPHLSQTIKQA